MDKEMQNKWDNFLVEVWFKSKGAKMHLIMNQFSLINDISFDDIFTLKRTPNCSHVLMQDIFGFLGRYFTNINNYLLDTKPHDIERINKIVKLLSKQVPFKDKKSVKEYSELRSTLWHEKTYEAAMMTGKLLQQSRLENGGHHWSKVK